MTATAIPSVRVRKKLRLRPFLKLWHRWFGLGAALWLFLLAVTGSVITFYNEIDTWLNPDLRRIEAPANPSQLAPVALAVQTAQAEVPGFQANFIDLPDHSQDVIWMVGRVGDAPAQLFSDPRDGSVLGWRESGKLSLDRRHLVDLFYGAHIDLLLGPAMTWFLGLVSLLWVFDHIAAALLSVPKMRLWRDAFRIKGHPGGLRHLYDLHRAPGMWLLPVTLMLAVTGVTLAWPIDSREAVRVFSPVSERLDYDFPDATVADPISIDRAIAIGAPDGGVDSVRPIPRKGVYAVRTFDPRDLDDQGRMWTYVSMADGRIVARRHDNGEGAGDTFFAWQYPLHSGKAFGLAGRIIVFVAGVATAVFCVTGVMLWWRRRRRA